MCYLPTKHSKVRIFEALNFFCKVKKIVTLGFVMWRTQHNAAAFPHDSARFLNLAAVSGSLCFHPKTEHISLRDVELLSCIVWLSCIQSACCAYPSRWHHTAKSVWKEFAFVNLVFSLWASSTFCVRGPNCADMTQIYKLLEETEWDFLWFNVTLNGKIWVFFMQIVE